MAKKPIHPSIKEKLGYDADIPDAEFLSHWKQRSTQVCKPCWELKYCPYGPFVEQSPLLPSLRHSAIEHNEYLKKCLETGLLGACSPLSDEMRQRFGRLLEMHEEEPMEFARIVQHRIRSKELIEEGVERGESLEEILGMGELPPVQEYRVPLMYEEGKEPVEMTSQLESAIEAEVTSMKTALASGFWDDRHPIDSARREWFEKQVAEFDSSTFPEEIPPAVGEMECNIFGHICPVVFVSEEVTETSEDRRRGRYIPFHVKMRVVRRDNHTCQECGKHLRDDEVEFDHIIPVAKGGSTEEHNIRLTCFDCNREKSDGVEL